MTRADRRDAPVTATPPRDAQDRDLESLLTVSGTLLDALSKVNSAGPGWDAAALQLRTFFGACCAAVAAVETTTLKQEILGFSSTGLARDEVGPGLEQASGEAVRAASQGEPRWYPDLDGPSRGGPLAQLRRAGVRSLVIAPFSLCDGAAAIVSLGGAAPGQFGEPDARTLFELSRPIAMAMDRARLADGLARARLALGDRDAKAATLTRILSTLDATAAPDEVARTVAAELRTLTSADAVVIHEFDRETGIRTQATVKGTDHYRHPMPAAIPDAGTSAGARATRSACYDARDPGAGPPWLREAAVRLGLRSAVAVRLDGSSGPLGMLGAGCLEPGALPADALDTLTALAPPLAMVLERARIVASLREQGNQSRAILDILSALGPKDSFVEVAGPVAAAIRAMYGSDYCTIGLMQEDEVILAALDSAYELEWPVGSSMPRHNIEPATAANSNVAHVIGDLAAESMALTPTSQALRELGMRSSMRVLIGPPEAPVGVVTVGSSEPGRYTADDAARLAAIAHPLAVAIAYFEGRREADSRAARLESMNRVLTRLGSGGTPEQIAASFLAECRAHFRCEHAAVFVMDADTGAIRRLAFDSSALDAADLPEAVLSEADAGFVPPQSPVVIADIRESGKSGPLCDRLVAAGLIRSVEVPLTVNDRQIGSVCLRSKGAARFTPEDVETLAAFTRPFAIALERATAVASLAESEFKYRSLVAQAEEMIFVIDGASLQILEANEYTARSLGYTRDELVSLTADQLVNTDPEDVRQNIQATLERGEMHISDRVYKRKDGSLLDVDVLTSLVTYSGRRAVLALVRDVSEHKAIQAQLIQGQKMESLGLMAGNLAHDFNNLLTTILGFAGLLKRSPNLNTDERENLSLIEDASRRAADLTSRLLAFARGGLVRFGPVDLCAVVADTLQLAGPALHTGLEVSTSLPGGPVRVEGDASQIQQALLNILLNAKDAMPDGGNIAVTLSANAGAAMLTVSDTGAGMSEETRTRIFEPFYTTKPIGAGTGLGMAIAYGIVQGHHGDISVESALGAGTRFTITLPLLSPAANAKTVAEAFRAGEGNLILVVDDDEMVRRATSATLAAIGYNVVEAAGGATAIQVVQARPGRISAVLLDLVMPGMTGSETFRALTALRPDLPIIVCTGYAADAHIDTDVKRRIAGLVQKPFTPERLGRALAEAGVAPARQ